MHTRTATMESSNEMGSTSRTTAKVWTGRVIGSLAVLFLLFDGLMKLVKPAPVMEATARLQLPESSLVGIGLLLLTCTVLYAIPRTSVLGAVLLTGYLGGAVAIHVRSGDPAFPVLFPVIFGVLIWGSLALRDPRVPRLLGDRR